MSPALASLVQRESAIDDVIRAGNFPAHDPITRRFIAEARGRPFPSATVAAWHDVLLYRLRAEIRNGCTFRRVKEILGEAQGHETPEMTDAAMELVRRGCCEAGLLPEL